jgi:UDP-glucose 4-epimerase
VTKKILVTGGTGFIGSHTAVELLESGNEVIIYDNLSNSSAVVIDRIRLIAEVSLKGPISLTFVQGDIRDREKLAALFAKHSFDCVMHFAGLKAVGDSVKRPLEYYNNNIMGTICLCEVMAEANVKSLVFSSSATVYGEEAQVPYQESMPIGNTTNPYGTSKAMIEKILTDLTIADSQWAVALLRYFNPIGAHKSGLIGEDPKGVPNNLMPYICQVAVGKLKELSIFGDDYPTLDGTGVRDYIHVVDLAKGHLKALEKIQLVEKASGKGTFIWNLGTGCGSSVFEVIKAFELASDTKIPYSIKNRRPGDLANCWANVEKSLKELNWKTDYDLQAMVQDSWNWQRNNPRGYD